jgi:hypothetical protein
MLSSSQSSSMMTRVPLGMPSRRSRSAWPSAQSSLPSVHWLLRSLAPSLSPPHPLSRSERLSAIEPVSLSAGPSYSTTTWIRSVTFSPPEPPPVRDESNEADVEAVADV